MQAPDPEPSPGITAPPASAVQRTADALQARLAAQPSGSYVPSDLAVAAELGTSTATAFRAKRTLAARGIIALTGSGHRYRKT